MDERLEVFKTYKLYIGGQFPRTESGRYQKLVKPDGKLFANICLSSRKDLKSAAVAARNAFAGWSAREAFNRSQILYRMAEVFEGRKQQIVQELQLAGLTKKEAEFQVITSIDRLVYYAGWCDKFQQVFSSVNPVASSYFNFSILEPMGVVGIIAQSQNSFLDAVSLIAPAIGGGNTVLLIVEGSYSPALISFAEILATSDLPAGVVNILTGKISELDTHLLGHFDVNAVIVNRCTPEQKKKWQELSAANVKRFSNIENNFHKSDEENPYYISMLQEVKTTWHPIENIGPTKAGY